MPKRSGTAQPPLYDTDVIWSWNTRDGNIEINVHDAKLTIILTPADFRSMTNFIRIGGTQLLTKPDGPPLERRMKR